MALPDFLIVGAMKCGTSTLQAQLAAQPGIFMTTPKEPNFFSDDDVHAKGLAWYERLFENAAPGDMKGEASTHYTKLPTYPETLTRLRATMQFPKIIYLIRNPVARAVSHYMHEWTQGVMSAAIEEEFARHPEMISYGLYGMQIAPWVEAFGPGNVFLSSLEAMNRDPQALLDRVAAFLDLPGPLTWQPDKARVNVSAERVRRLPLHDLLIDNPVATKLRRTLVPQSIRDRIRKSRQITDRPMLSSAMKARLQASFVDDHALLKALFPDNTDIAASYPFLQE